VDNFAFNANVTFKNPILDVLKELITSIDKDATFDYLQLTMEEKNNEIITEHFSDIKDYPHEFSTFKLHDDNAYQGFTYGFFLPVGCYSVGLNDALHETRRIWAEKSGTSLNILHAQHVCLILFYHYISTYADHYVDEVASKIITTNTDEREAIKEAILSHVKDFVTFFSKYTEFLEDCRKRNLNSLYSMQSSELQFKEEKNDDDAESFHDSSDTE
jgi:hypothetical protein